MMRSILTLINKQYFNLTIVSHYHLRNTSNNQIDKPLVDENVWF